MRRERLDVNRFGGEKNALRHWMSVRNPVRVAFNTLLLSVARYMPLRLKNGLTRLAGVKMGGNVSLGLGVMFDIFRPDLIEVGENTTIGYNTVILGHETTQDEFRLGRVEIGDNVLIGANTTVLPGVRIGDGARISANSLVNRDVGEDAFVGGVPIRDLED